MKWKPYPAYKPSGVEWLGDVPAHWDVGRLKFVASINDEVLTETTDPELELQYVDIGSVDPIAGITTLEPVAFDRAPSRARRIVRDGDAIVSTVRPYLRAIAPIRSPQPNTIVSTGFAVVRPKRLRSEFLAHALAESGFAESLVARAVGVSYPAVNPSEIADSPLPWPPSDEQSRIAEFLGAKTAQLDALSARKRVLIERLREKRTALMSRTVTRGLPPEAARAAGLAPHPKLKPSGIPWLGDIPEHWEAVRLRHHLVRIEQGWSPECEARQAEEHEWGVLKVGCVNGAEFDSRENKALPDTVRPLAEFEIRAGDILMSRANTAELLGSTALVRSVRPRLLLCDKLYRLQVRGVDASFLVRVLNTAVARFQYERDATGTSSSMKNIGQDTVRNLLCPTPPFAEQQAIAEYLDRETARIDTLIEKVEAAIERLQEYRQALITAAVTGKIDVRDPAPPEALAPQA